MSASSRMGQPLGRPPRLLELLLGLAFILCLTLFQFARADLIPVEHGLGYDGYYYYLVTVDYQSGLKEMCGLYGGERVQRILPSVLVSTVMDLLSVAKSRANIIAGFMVLNLVCLLLSCLVWWQIARAVGLSALGFWFGFVSLFLAYPTAKDMHFYPVLTDASAFLLSGILLLCYLRRSLLGGLATLAIGCYVSSSFWLLGVPLLVIERIDRREAFSEGPNSRRAALAISLVGVIGVIIFAYQARRRLEVMWGLLPLSAVLLFGTFFLGYRGLFAGVNMAPKDWKPQSLWTKFSARGVLGVGVTMLAVFILASILKPDLPAHHSTLKQLYMHGGRGVIRPFQAQISHALYFGPVLIFMALNWRSVCQEAHSFGLALPVTLSVALAFSVDTESRHIIQIAPVLALLGALVFDRFSARSRFMAVFIGLSLLYSRFWLTLGVGWTDAWAITEFPQQLHFMGNGAFVSAPVALVQTIIVLASAALLWKLNPAAEPSAPASAQNA